MPTSTDAASSAASPPQRLSWIDDLRTFVILLVVHMHACCTYSHVGDWYVKRDAEPSFGVKLLFIFWQSHLQSFFMGLLFFLAGYFTWSSWKRRGTISFIRERLFRLGIPVLLYMLVIHPFILRAINPWDFNFPPALEWWSHYLGEGHFIARTGPLWFAFALLLFSIGWAWLAPKNASATSNASTSTPPGARAIFLFALALGLGSFAVRTVQPVGTNVLNFQLCFFTQYVGAFVVGIAARRHEWLDPLATSSLSGKIGVSTLIAGPLLLLILFLVGRKDGTEVFVGGWHWQALALAVWEQLTGVGLALGLLHLFKKHVTRERPALKWLSDRAFAVYVLHAPVIIWLYVRFQGLTWPTIPMVALLTVTGLVLTFLLADLVRCIPGVNRVL